jgi:hypothetical protein
MNFQKPDTTTLLETLSAWWPVILLCGLVLAVGIVCIVRRPTAPTFSLSKRDAGRTRDREGRAWSSRT